MATPPEPGPPLRLVGLEAGVAISRVRPSYRKDKGTRYGVPLTESAVATQASVSRSSRCRVSCLRWCGVRAGGIMVG